MLGGQAAPTHAARTGGAPAAVPSSPSRTLACLGAVLPMNALVAHVYTKVTQRPDGCPFCGNEEVPYTATK